MDTNEVQAKIDQVIADMQAIKTMLRTAESTQPGKSHAKLMQCITDNVCPYCGKTLEGTLAKDIVRNVHRSCYRKIKESPQSLETHVELGLLGLKRTAGRKPNVDLATKLLRDTQEKNLAQSVAAEVREKYKKNKKTKP